MNESITKTKLILFSNQNYKSEIRATRALQKSSSTIAMIAAQLGILN